MGRSTRIGIGIGSAALTSGLLVFGAMAHADSPSAPEPVAAPLVERADCDQQAPTPAASALAGGALATTSQGVMVNIPATSLLTLDATGRVTAATTNTGCAPRPTDHLYWIMPDGSVIEATDPLPLRAWTGDFTLAGVAVPQLP